MISRISKTFLAGAMAASAALAMDAGKTMEQICLENGFAVEKYTVVTPDDYILSLYRIPGTFAEIQETSQAQKPAVLFMHGLDADMMQWVVNDAERANAFILARAGYDVWMGNNRGSRYSRSHLSLTPDDKAYWDYYQEEMGTKDVPTFIDFVLDKTGLETLSYVGHSQGTTQLFLGASLMPDYFKQKINVFIALAPVASTEHLKIELLRLPAEHIKIVEYLLTDVKSFYSWFPSMPRGSEALDTFCRLFPKVCKGLVAEVFDPTVDNTDRFEMGVQAFPSGQTYRAMVYYAQSIRGDYRFSLYNYGPIKNMKVYGTKEPPVVPLDAYDVPTVLMSGDLDKFAPPEDVAWLSEQLGDKVVFQQEYHLNHLAFSIADDMSFFSVDAVAQLQKFNPTETKNEVPEYLQ